MSLALRKKIPTSKVVGYFDAKTEVKTVVKLTSKNSSKETLTNQSFKNTCDINCILQRFRKTGVIDHVAKYEPQYGELSNIDFETAFNNVKAIEETFDRLPKKIRENFHNKPENFLAYMENEENRNAERLLSTSASRDGTADIENAEKTKDSNISKGDKKAAE